MSPWLSRLSCLLALALSYGVALWARLPLAEAAAVGSDSLGPLMAAWSAGPDHLPKPPNPEAGPSLWITQLPVIWGASSLLGAMKLRFALGALVAPAGAAAAWALAHGSPVKKGAIAASAGLLLAADPGLLETLQSAFRGYGGPEWIALGTLGLALGLRGVPGALGVGVVALVVAAGQHPLAFGAALGALLALPLVARAVSWRSVGIAVLLGLAASLPRLAWVWELSSCDGPSRWACVRAVATSSTVVDPVRSALLVESLHDRFAVDLGLGAWVLAGGVVLGLLGGRRHAPLAVFAVGGVLGVIALGLTFHTLRPYHLRHLAAPVAVLAALGLGRLGPAGLIVALLAVVPWLRHPPPLLDPGGPARHDLVAEALPSGPVRVDNYWASGAPTIEASGVVLAAVLAGRDPADFDVSGPRTAIVVVSGLEEPWRGGGVRLASGPRWEARAYPSLSTATDEICSTHGARGAMGNAYDWMTMLHPSQARLDTAGWQCP